MTTDNRTNEPSEAQVEAAAKAIYGNDPAWGYVNNYGYGEVASQWRHLGESIQEMFRLKARAALVAAAGAGKDENDE